MYLLSSSPVPGGHGCRSACEKDPPSHRKRWLVSRPNTIIGRTGRRTGTIARQPDSRRGWFQAMTSANLSCTRTGCRSRFWRCWGAVRVLVCQLLLLAPEGERGESSWPPHANGCHRAYLAVRGAQVLSHTIQASSTGIPSILLGCLHKKETRCSADPVRCTSAAPSGGRLARSDAQPLAQLTTNRGPHSCNADGSPTNHRNKARCRPRKGGRRRRRGVGKVENGGAAHPFLVRPPAGTLWAAVMAIMCTGAAWE